MIKKGDTAAWKWGNGEAKGTVSEVRKEKTTITSKKQTITRNGDKNNPAVKIKQDDGTVVLKSASEVTVK